MAASFAREGADVAICYLTHHEDAKETCGLVAAEGRRAIAIAGDASDEAFAADAVDAVLSAFGKLDILVNHVGIQTLRDSFMDVSAKQLHETFAVNVYSMCACSAMPSRILALTWHADAARHAMRRAVYMTRAALPRMEDGGSIINTTSINAYKVRSE